MKSKFEITYIHHNCFILETGGDCLLFDYPSASYLKNNETEIIKSKIKGSRLLVFISHGHPDHYSPAVFEFEKIVPEAHFIISDDVAARSPRSKIITVSPDSNYAIAGYRVETFKSNDQGVAFLIHAPEAMIFFGGDLAKWSWDEFDAATRNHMETVFYKMIAKLKKHKIDIAFSNADERLDNWAGGAEFAKLVAPGVFVPMHSFGNMSSIKKFVEDNRREFGENIKVFEYSGPGDTFYFE